MIVTLCGSTRFKSGYSSLNILLSLAGNVVMSCAMFQRADRVEITEEDKRLFDYIHFKKIDLSDVIAVVDMHTPIPFNMLGREWDEKFGSTHQVGYIGESTKREEEYARKMGKGIFYLSDFLKEAQLPHDLWLRGCMLQQKQDLHSAPDGWFETASRFSGLIG